MSPFSTEVCLGLKCIFLKIYKQFIFFLWFSKYAALLVCLVTVRYLDMYILGNKSRNIKHTSYRRETIADIYFDITHAKQYA